MNIEGKTDKQLRRMCVNHWKRMLKLTVEDIRDGKEYPDDENCAFCNKYIDKDCRGCPVFVNTGEPYCHGTPFTGAAYQYEHIKDCVKSDLSESDLENFYKAVQKEIDFLEGLEL